MEAKVSRDQSLWGLKLAVTHRKILFSPSLQSPCSCVWSLPSTLPSSGDLISIRCFHFALTRDLWTTPLSNSPSLAEPHQYITCIFHQTAQNAIPQINKKNHSLAIIQTQNINTWLRGNLFVFRWEILGLPFGEVYILQNVILHYLLSFLVLIQEMDNEILKHRFVLKQGKGWYRRNVKWPWMMIWCCTASYNSTEYSTMQKI